MISFQSFFDPTMSFIVAPTILDFPCMFSSEAAHKLDRVSMSFYPSVNIHEFKQRRCPNFCDIFI